MRIERLLTAVSFALLAIACSASPETSADDVQKTEAADAIERLDTSDTAVNPRPEDVSSPPDTIEPIDTKDSHEPETEVSETETSDTQVAETDVSETDSPEPTGFGSVVRLENHCTAVKIGPREILTAGHCVAKNSEPVLRHTFKSDHSFKIYNGERIKEGSSGRQVTVDKTEVHPEWMQCAFDTQGVCGTYAHATKYPHPPDIALIVVKENLPEPHAQVDTAWLESGEQVIVTGYGCEERENRGALIESQLKHGVNTVLSKDKAGPFDRAYPNYFPTPGESEPNGNITLCPGDSGGPVFRVDTNPRQLVGINSTHQTNSNQTPSSLNVHTRVSEETRHDIASWLRNARP